MTKRKIGYLVLACAFILVIAGIFYFNNHGAPAVSAADYQQDSSQLEAGGELAALPDSTPGVPGMNLIAEDGSLGLYFHPETTEVAVRDKKTGQIWYSNPADRDGDAIASAFEKEMLASQLSVSFRDTTGALDSYGNFTQSISKKQFKVEGIKNGVRITYTLGDMSLGIDALPKYIDKARLKEKVLSKLDASLAKYVSARYYPSESDPNVLERLDEQIKKQLVLDKMLGAFTKAGYSEADLAEDNAAHGAGGKAGADKPKFVIPLEYRLDGGSLTATIPMGHVEETASYRIRSIDLLPYFGAAGVKGDGYMFVPDGTGSLINLNNGKIKEEQYVQRVYGDDPNDNSRNRGQVIQSARMPVFGLKNGPAAWFAVIEKGDGLASIAADVSGKQNSFNHAYSTYAVRGEDELELYTGATIQQIDLLADKLFKGDITVRYSFLQGEDASYSGMARLYQNKLVTDQKLKPLQAQNGLPFYLDILGTIDKRTSFLGVPYHTIESMTTFDQAGEIADRLKQDGVSDLQMRYLGWFNKGVQHKTPTGVKVDGDNGGKKDLLRLAEKLEAMGGKLYPDVAFQQVFHDDGGFAPSSDAARFVTRDVAKLSPYDRAMNRMDDYYGSYYLLSPAKLPSFVEDFTKSYGRLKLDGLSLRDLGSTLIADYRNSRLIFRETAKNIVNDELGKLQKSYPNLLVSGANSYAWGYSQNLTDVPTSTSAFNLADEEVPFYQMVIHGFAAYSGQAMNLADEQDLNQELLHAIELGTAPHFLWSYEDSSELKSTHYNDAFSSKYENWYDQALGLYKKADQVLGKLQQSKMIEHTRLQDGVVEVKYDNGTSIFVNYTDAPVTANGVQVNAHDYAVGGDSK
ncbi:DUF5696 domain-containing protein [Gorillibacterium sp. sgz500922]|uniref:DUF5696 domain-containing protein n=1 Tax=Gorillibacterium sp. sgz500922 TaxID=3446694 RepID=UPI003F66AFB1